MGWGRLRLKRTKKRTQEELDTTLRPCVEEYAECKGISVAEVFALLKKNYDGYHFSKKSKDVYAPFSLLNALNDKDINHYWFESGTSRSLLEHLARFPITRALDYDGIAVSENLVTPVMNTKRRYAPSSLST